MPAAADVLLRHLAHWTAWALGIGFGVALLCQPAIAQGDAARVASARWNTESVSRFDPVEITDEERRFLAEHPRIRVAIANENYEPLQYIDESGQIRGLFVNVLRTLGSSIGIELEPVIYERWDQVLEAVRNRQADVIPYAGYSKSRDEYLDFTLGVARAPGGLLALDTENTLQQNPSLDNVRVGVGRGYLSEKWLGILFPDAIPVPLDSMSRIINALRDGSIKYYLGPAVDTLGAAQRQNLNNLELKQPLYYGSGWSHIAVRSDWPVLTQLFNRIISGGRERLSAFSQEAGIHIGAQMKSPIRLTAEQARLIAETAVLRVGAVRGLYSLNDIDAEGTHLGIAAEYTSIISDRLGVAIKVEAFDSVAQMIEAARNGQIDLIPFFTRTPEREKDFAFTEPFVEIPYMLLGNTEGALYWDLASLKDHRLALARKHPLIPLIREQYPQIDLVETSNGQESVEYVATGRADAAVEVKLFANQLINGEYAGQVRNLAQVDLLPAAFSMAVPARLADLVPLLNASLQSATPSERESAMRRWVAVDLEPVRDLRKHLKWMLAVAAALTLLMALTAFWNRRLARENRRRLQAEQRLVDMTDRLRTGVFQFHQNAAGQIKTSFTNAMSRQLSRVQAGDMRDDHRGFFDWVFHEDKPNVMAALNRSLSTGEPFRESFRFTYPSGEVGWIVAEATARHEPDGGITWNGYLFDLTSERRLTERLDATLAAKDQFIAIAGHELRAPVHNAGLAVAGVAKSVSDPQGRQSIELARQALQSLAELVNDLLDFSRANIGALKLNRQPTNLRALMTNISESFEMAMREKSLRFSTDVRADVPTEVVTDQVRLRQILYNLIGNAQKYTDAGSVRLTVSLDQAPDGLSRANARGEQVVFVRFEVEDTGLGIAAEHLQTVFEPFATIGPANRRNTGLGLAVVQRIVKRMGGQISVNSTLDVGSVFSVVIPMPIALAPDEDDQKSVETIEMSRPLESDARGKVSRLLVVDDDRLGRVMLAMLLNNSGYQADDCGSADEALAKLGNIRYDAVITDYRMPGASGLELALAVRERFEPDGQVPMLVAMTGGVAQEIEELANDAFDAILLKPVTVNQVKSVLETRIGAGAVQ